MPTDAERAYWTTIATADPEPFPMTPGQRIAAAMAATEALNALRRARRLAPMEQSEPPEELAFYERARARGLLG